jgi:hypothetical protein
VPQLIAIGTATDCYQPVERELRLTRGLIEVMHETNHPFALVTKSSTVERDIDLIAPMARRARRRLRDHHHARRATWRASWSRAPPRRTGACARCARWPSTASPAA